MIHGDNWHDISCLPGHPRSGFEIVDPVLTHFCHAGTSLVTDSLGFGGSKWDHFLDSSGHLVNAYPIPNWLRVRIPTANIISRSERHRDRPSIPLRNPVALLDEVVLGSIPNSLAEEGPILFSVDEHFKTSKLSGSCVISTKGSIWSESSNRFKEHPKTFQACATSHLLESK